MLDNNPHRPIKPTFTDIQPAPWHAQAAPEVPRAAQPAQQVEDAPPVHGGQQPAGEAPTTGGDNAAEQPAEEAAAADPAQEDLPAEVHDEQPALPDPDPDMAQQEAGDVPADDAAAEAEVPEVAGQDEHAEAEVPEAPEPAGQDEQEDDGQQHVDDALQVPPTDGQVPEDPLAHPAHPHQEDPQPGTSADARAADYAQMALQSRSYITRGAVLDGREPGKLQLSFHRIHPIIISFSPL